MAQVRTHSPLKEIMTKQLEYLVHKALFFGMPNFKTETSVISGPRSLQGRYYPLHLMFLSKRISRIVELKLQDRWEIDDETLYTQFSSIHQNYLMNYH